MTEAELAFETLQWWMLCAGDDLSSYITMDILQEFV
jgi:hypothetical protein